MGMGHPGLWCNKSFSHNCCPHDQHVPNQQTHHCPAPEWQARTLHAHMHSWYPCPPHLSATRPYHLQPSFSLPHLCCHPMQCRLQCHLHQDWMDNTYRGKVNLCCSKCTCTGLWMTPLCPTPPSTANKNQANTLPTAITANLDATSSMDEYAHCIHQALCSPLATTLIQALKCSRELATISASYQHPPALFNN
jgi:hypothetical protein